MFKMLNTLTCRPFFVSSIATTPRDVVVVLQTSASMRGDKLFEAKLAVLTVMETLGIKDRVNILFTAVDNLISLCSGVAHFVDIADYDFKKGLH